MIGWAALGILAGIFALGIWSLSRKIGRSQRTLERISATLESIGARQLDDQTWEVHGRRYHLALLPPTFLSNNFYLKVALYTPRLFEFSIRRAEGISTPAIPELAGDPLYRQYDIQGPAPDALRRYLDSADVRQVVEKAMHGRWRMLAQQHLQLGLEDNIFHDSRFDRSELEAALKALQILDNGPEPSVEGGVVTFRSGFEEAIPPWHWPVDALRKLPPQVTRCVISYYHQDPYLNLPLAGLILELCGQDRPLFLVEQEDLGFIGHAFGECYERRGSVLQTREARTVVAADHFMDGNFFQGFVALPEGADAAPFEAARRHNFHETAVDRLKEIGFSARRLLDEEASWFSGEIEILSARLDAAVIREAVERLAEKCGAKMVLLDRRFSVKMFRDESFEYST